MIKSFLNMGRFVFSLTVVIWERVPLKYFSSVKIESASAPAF